MSNETTSDQIDEVQEYSIPNGISKDEIILDPAQSHNAMKKAHATAQPKMFEIVDFDIEDITFYDVETSVNSRTGKPIQNIEFEYNGEERRMAVENVYFYNMLRKKLEEFAVAEEGTEILVPLPINNILGKKLKLQKDGGYWLY